MEIKVVVVKLNIHDDKDKQRAMKAVSSLAGINSVEVNVQESKMTVIGEVDPVDVIGKLRKQWNAQIVTVGPPKPKEEKKDGDKKEGEKKDGDKKDGEKKSEKDQIADLIKAYNAYHPPRPPMHYYHVQSIEENPNSCTIC